MTLLLTLNVCGLPSPIGPLRSRVAELGRRIEAAGPDVVNLQEVWTRRSFALVRAALRSFPHAAWWRGVAGQPAGGLVTLSRTPLESVAYTSFRGARVGGSRGGLRFRARLALNTRLQGVLTCRLGDGTAIANTHLTANRDGDWSAGNRHHAFQRSQLALLHAAVARLAADRVVLSGDFNIAAGGPLYPRIVDDGAWHDPFLADDPPTFHAALLPSGRSKRIDYVLVRGAEVVETALLDTGPGPAFVSDHLGLLARIT
jgi:endonuclease/exonuclease/phosphatase family metal-dependent hydrolase